MIPPATFADLFPPLFPSVGAGQQTGPIAQRSEQRTHNPFTQVQILLGPPTDKGIAVPSASGRVLPPQ